MTVHEIGEAPHRDGAPRAAGGEVIAVRADGDIAASAEHHQLAQRKHKSATVTGQARGGDAYASRPEAGHLQVDRQYAGVGEIFLCMVGNDDPFRIILLAGNVDPKAERESVACLRFTIAIRRRGDENDSVEQMRFSQIQLDPLHRILLVDVATVVAQPPGDFPRGHGGQVTKFLVQRLLLAIESPHLRTEEVSDRLADVRRAAWGRKCTSRRQDDGEGHDRRSGNQEMKHAWS